MIIKSVLLPRWNTLAATISAPAWPVAAEVSRDEQIDERFAAADINHDGQPTLAGAEAGRPRVAANFAMIDAGRSGTPTLAEIKALADR